MVDKRWALALAGAVIIQALCGNALAEDAPKPPTRAVWADPEQVPAPWLDARALSFAPQAPEILATGRSVALVRMADGAIHAVDADRRVLGRIAPPQNVRQFFVDGEDRLLAFDGEKVWAAQSWREAAEGFTVIFGARDMRLVSVAGNALAYSDDAAVSFVDLATSTMRTVNIADFFDDAVMASRTPDAVQKAKSAKKKSKKPAPTAATAGFVGTAEGIWMRDDGVALVRVRSLMNVRTFVTRDGGESWERLDDAPTSLVQSHGWIWDGTDRVLGRDGAQWVTVCGPRISAASQWSLVHAPGNAAPASPWIRLPDPEPLDAQDAACTPVDMIPDAAQTPAPSLFADSLPQYAPAWEDAGFAMGLYAGGPGEPSGDSEAAATPKHAAWMAGPDGEIRDIALPDHCTPRFVAADHGLGIALCDAPGNELTAYVRTADSDWVAEALLPTVIANDTKLAWALDGTLVAGGNCESETVEVPIMPDGDALAAGIESLPTETQTKNVCTVAVRRPGAVGDPELWRVERVEDSGGIVPLSAGRVLTLEGKSENQKKLVLRTTAKTETVVEEFDPSPYQGVVMTKEGCFALYDGSIPAQELRDAVTPAKPEGDADSDETAGAAPATTAPSVRLVSTEGKLAQLDCITSRALAEAGLSGDAYVEEEKGDDRFGLRLSAGAFLANEVYTWFMRAEGLIPFRNGRYEIGLAYRMAGGNAATAMGHLGMVAMRWRYDELELFDFAVGAGIGFGSMCGYDKAADKDANAEQETAEGEETQTTSESPYKKCSNLSVRFELSGYATYKMSKNWKLFLSATMLGGTTWGADLFAGFEIRF